MENNIHAHIISKLDYFYQSGTIPHIIFHGSSGSGKRTLVNDFIMKIYQQNKQRIKANVMTVNCAHGKGIKFIRDELKFFAKTNVQSSSGILFKTILLLNAEYLTIDAQSALRRCIELFSYNTRFFIIVENKQKLLNPILSRFCEIYVPEWMDHSTTGHIINLHDYSKNRHYMVDTSITINSGPHYVAEKIGNLPTDGVDHTHLLTLAEDFYENGISCIDILSFVKQEGNNVFSDLEKAEAGMCFDKIKAEYRSEKLLMFYFLDYLFLRSNKDIKNMATI
jgi:DNA polymerase III delta prime subunit